ncbi:MAG TPA: hypothetical protein VGB24_03075 [Longimicrobium sp.]|jgi:hypothetical protein|uniref:hypothetical protein n=1 Tax=Longimicrobium sp. TaxID=2029185 RepID=UPI002EDAA0CC
MKPNRRRIILYVAGILAAVVVPVAGAFLLAFLGPAPYLLNEDGLGPEWSSPRQYPDGSTVSVTAFPSSAAAVHEAESISQSLPTSSTSQTMNVVRYTRADDQRRGLLLPVDRRLVQVEAADDRAVDERLRALPFIRENPEKNLMWLLFTDHTGVALSGLGLYILGLGVFMARGASWAAEIAPAARTPPVAVDTLRSRILALNDLDLPFHVREESNRLVAEWRIADARWVGLMEAGGLRDVHRIYMELDPDGHGVRSLDERRTVSWSAGIARLGGSFSFFRGISFFEYSRGVMMGVFFRDGRWTMKAYDYRFVLSEMKAPLVQAIVGSGWRFTPVVTLSRSLSRVLG